MLVLKKRKRTPNEEAPAPERLRIQVSRQAIWLFNLLWSNTCLLQAGVALPEKQTEGETLARQKSRTQVFRCEPPSNSSILPVPVDPASYQNDQHRSSWPGCVPKHFWIFFFWLRSTATTQAPWRLWLRVEFHWKLIVSIPRMQGFIFGLFACYGVFLFFPTFGWVTLFAGARELATIVTLADPKWVHKFCSANLWTIGVGSRTRKLRVGQVTSVAGPIFSSNLWICKLYSASSVWLGFLELLRKV